MVYVGFTEQITKRYGVIIKNWPLTDFKNPSSVGTKTELEILWSSWNSDTAHFYRMTASEYTEWLAAYEASPNVDQLGSGGSRFDDGDQAGDGEVGATTGGQAAEGEGVDSASGTLQSAAPTHTPHPATGSSNFIAMNMVTDTSGVAIAVKSTARKKRSDAGKPRKRKAQVDGGAA